MDNFPAGTKIPSHLAIIPDGNRRWAKEQHLPTFVGHQEGFKRLNELSRAAHQWGVHTVTVWAFSTENWQRNKRELNYLMRMYQKNLDDYLQEAEKEGVRIIHLGRKDRIPQKLTHKLSEAEIFTQKNKQHILNVALDYGGRDEVLRAVGRLLRQKRRKEVTEEDILAVLDTAGQPYPYPDLLIRTSGEERTSGFLLWQMAYTEFYFTPKHLPDFTVKDLKRAILEYSRRERRFGK